MKRIRLFIASSAELKGERMELVDLVLDLNHVLEKYSVEIEPVLWEYMDSSMREGRKEDEYLAELRMCEICIILFWETLGEYTIEELDVALKERNEGRLPKHIYAMFKEPSNEISEELKTFKESFKLKYANVPLLNFKDDKSLRNQVEGILMRISK